MPNSGAEVDSLKYAHNAVKQGHTAPLERMSYYELSQFMVALGDIKRGRRRVLEERLCSGGPGSTCAFFMRDAAWACGESFRICAASFAQNTPLKRCIGP